MTGDEPILLSQSAFLAFLQVLSEPPARPSAKLLAAVRDYNDLGRL